MSLEISTAPGTAEPPPKRLTDLVAEFPAPLPLWTPACVFAILLITTSHLLRGLDRPSRGRFTTHDVFASTQCYGNGVNKSAEQQQQHVQAALDQCPRSRPELSTSPELDGTSLRASASHIAMHTRELPGSGMRTGYLDRTYSPDHSRDSCASTYLLTQAHGGDATVLGHAARGQTYLSLEQMPRPRVNLPLIIALNTFAEHASTVVPAKH
ncbi:hypothetical protein S7711_11487 [Stachybotrys chartarum IBT 7711]|uniref:Uncharacterized protein n=1 Tax=Stachybotrys chartarum (strain CBS 109288 / IBT 7711) TaxID=1280523 RepID=A0A084AEV3_STACB|nr:hypothetical protein S7711_11487 [Stachybotrys chartarum IBT 7711]